MFYASLAVRCSLSKISCSLTAHKNMRQGKAPDGFEDRHVPTMPTRENVYSALRNLKEGPSLSRSPLLIIANADRVSKITVDIEHDVRENTASS